MHIPVADEARPGYDWYRNMGDWRGPKAAAFAEQILATSAPFLAKPAQDLDVVDVGCGYGHTTVELARRCSSVVGIEPALELVASAAELATDLNLPNLHFRQGGVESLPTEETFDLVVLDNVYEHLPDQLGALRQISAALRPGGAAFILTPNKLWPLEAHYRLPFLGYLPLPLANWYLRRSGRGGDYTDASYAPTLRRLRRQFGAHPELTWRLVLPASLEGTMSGAPVHYRVGAALIKRFPRLWLISKSLLVVATKTADVAPSDKP